jgi:hypothetical protein
MIGLTTVQALPGPFCLASMMTIVDPVPHSELEDHTCGYRLRRWRSPARLETRTTGIRLINRAARQPSGNEPKSSPRTQSICVVVHGNRNTHRDGSQQFPRSQALRSTSRTFSRIPFPRTLPLGMTQSSAATVWTAPMAHALTYRLRYDPPSFCRRADRQPGVGRNRLRGNGD